MITPKHPDATATVVAPPRRRPRTLAALLVAAALLTLMPIASASATDYSGGCDNGIGDEYQLLSGDFGLPIWLGVQPHDSNGTAWICYGTGAPGSPKTIGGMLRVRPTTEPGVYVRNYQDDSASVRADFTANASVRPTVTPGGASGGQEITFEIPFAVCSGVCYANDKVATTGLILGTLSQRSAPGGTSLAYSVSELCLMVNGIRVTNCDTDVALPGLTTTGNSPVNVGTGGATPGPCVVGVCIPSIDYVGTSGRQLATIYLPGNTSIPVYGVRVCAYQRTGTTPCPA